MRRSRRGLERKFRQWFLVQGEKDSQPRQAGADQGAPVPPQDEDPRDFLLLHRALLVGSGVYHLHPRVKYEKRRYESEGEADAPDTVAHVRQLLRVRANGSVGSLRVPRVK